MFLYTLHHNIVNDFLNILQSIRSECESFNYYYTCNESKKPQNKNLNRYRDVAPYDHTRIILQRGVCDYIHANLIRVNISCEFHDFIA